MNVDFYFHYGCPWSYLASGRLREVAMRTGATITWKPVLIDRVQARLGAVEAAPHPPAVPARARYAVKDLADWAAFCGVEIRHPGPFPLPAQWSARGGIVAARLGKMPVYSEAVFRACLRDCQDIASLEVVTRIAGAVSLGTDFVRAVRADDTLQALEAHAAELLQRGGFGVPTLFVGDDIYFGNDRMPLVEFALSRAPEHRFVVPGSHGQS